MYSTLVSVSCYKCGFLNTFYLLTYLLTDVNTIYVKHRQLTEVLYCLLAEVKPA